MNTFFILPQEESNDQAHLQFQRLMQSVTEVTSTAWADARSEADQDDVRAFECDIADAIGASDIRQKIANLKEVVAKWGVAI